MKIAVIGSGIAGLTSAYLLSKAHEVDVFEANDYIGGHTATVDVEGLAIDTGFIVFNDRTYPRFRYLMRELGVGWKDTEMSFSVHNPDTGLEYNGHSLATLFAQKRNLFRPSFYRMLFDIMSFNQAAKTKYQDVNGQVESLDSVTLAQFVDELKLGQMFKDNYLFPMCAAIWSATIEDVAELPLGFFLRFFMNHGLLNIADRPQWAVINGGSRSYIEPMIAGFKDRIHLNTPISKITRHDDYVTVATRDGTERTYDHLVLACHSDQALRMLSDASDAEREVLGAIGYQPNEVVLHKDIGLLPKRKAAWASWNYWLPSHASNEPGKAPEQQLASVTYNMNILQGLQSDQTYCVTLNNTAKIKPELILRKFIYHHPEYSLTSMAARKQRDRVCGQQRTHFAGAYWYNGFHEDGVRSAFDVAKRFDLAPEVEDTESA